MMDGIDGIARDRYEIPEKEADDAHLELVPPTSVIH
jgi:hypothetical protein